MGRALAKQLAFLVVLVVTFCLGWSWGEQRMLDKTLAIQRMGYQEMLISHIQTDLALLRLIRTEGPSSTIASMESSISGTVHSLLIEEPASDKIQESTRKTIKKLVDYNSEYGTHIRTTLR